jgi:hypothetical protein
MVVRVTSDGFYEEPAKLLASFHPLDILTLVCSILGHARAGELKCMC